MSDFRKIDCLGWWENELGHRFKVVHISDGCGFAVTLNDRSIKPIGFVINETSPCRHLPDCTGWDWKEPEPVKEIEFPDEIDDSIQWIVLGERGSVGLCKDEPSLGQYCGWKNVKAWIPYCIKLPGIPTLDDVGGDYLKAKWKRKAKSRSRPAPWPWTPWFSGTCPVDSKVEVEIKMRSGKTSKGHARIFRWTWEQLNGDIIAYRIMEDK